MRPLANLRQRWTRRVVEDGGVLPTPAVALVARRERFDVGVVISDRKSVV
mgnify:CR=1 FL=1